MIRQAVLLCGGMGTRLGERTVDMPKPLLDVSGRPLLDRTIEMLAAQGVEHFLLAAGFRGDLIEERYRDQPIAGATIETIIEEEALGTAGCLHLLADRLEEEFLLVYADIFLDFDVVPLAERHQNSGALATLLVRQSDHPWDSHLVDAREDGTVREFVFKQEEGRLYRNLGNAAFYALNRRILDFIPEGQKSDYGKNVFPAALAAEEKLVTYELPPGQWVRDMGTPDRLEVVERYLERRRLIAAARREPRTIDTVFLDRDGTINVHDGHLASWDQFEFLPGALDGIRRLTEAGKRLVVITNQPAIARGLATVEAVEDIHARMCAAIEEAGGKIEAVYYSPFHPETHHGEGVLEFRRASDCRKPGTGMILQAVEELGLDLASSVMVGDTANDILAGRFSGIRTCLVGNLHLQEELAPDYAAVSLAEVADAILSGALDPPDPGTA